MLCYLIQILHQNIPGLSNQECTTNLRLSDKPTSSITQQWRNITPQSKNICGSKLHESPKMVSIQHKTSSQRKLLEEKRGRTFGLQEMAQRLTDLKFKSNIDYGPDTSEDAAEGTRLVTHCNQ